MMAPKQEPSYDPSVTQALKELAGSIGKALDGAADLSNRSPRTFALPQHCADRTGPLYL